MATDSSNPEALTDLVRRGAVVVASVTAALLLLAVVGELLRRRHRARRVLAVIDALVPVTARPVAVSVLALVSAIGVPRTAGADDSVRGWLGRPTTRSTVVGPVVTPDALDALTATTTTTVPVGPPVFVPSTTTPPTTAPPAVAVPPVPPPSAATTPPAPPELGIHVVRVGDCLWSIAANQLGAGADARAIDVGWRRIYATNRDAVGPDPNLIHPGLVLRLPPLDVQP